MSEERGSNFFLGFLFMSRAKREALSAVYSYCRLIDDIVDSAELPKDEARRQLDFWKEEVARLYAGEPTHPVARRLLPHVRTYTLPKEGFLEMIRGCALDLEGTRYQTPEELENYMRGVASSAGRLSVEIFGYQATPPERMREFATLFGYAFQLTNIIRDVGADLELGRVYIPASDMKEAGYTEQQLLLRDHSAAFDRLMQILYRRAQTYYRRARSLVDFRDRPALLPAEVMAHIYEALLEDIRKDEFRVLFHRHRLPRWRKALQAGKAWLYCHGL
ncbi:MAG: squalene/phytoene synthase family protein [Elusimicrobia bacterium]|nr:squalene/phytoene synthase family protein [Elusimicrobiota bacterium]